MHDFREQCQTLFHAMLCLSTMFYETIIRLGFCDIQKNQGLGKRYQTRPLACVQTSLSLQIKSGRGEGWGASVHRLRPLGSSANTYLDIDYSGYHKTLIQLLSFSGTKPNYFLSMWESYNHAWTKVFGHLCVSGAFSSSHRSNPFPHPTNNVGRVYPEFFSEFQLCIGWGEGELQENFEKGALFWREPRNDRKIWILHYCPNDFCDQGPVSRKSR